MTALDITPPMDSVVLEDNIEKIIKKYTGVIKQNIRNASDIEDVEQEVRIYLYNNISRLEDKIINYNAEGNHTYFFKLFATKTIDFDRNKNNVEFYQLLSKKGYMKEYKRSDKEQLFDDLALNLSYKCYLNPKFVHEIIRRIDEKTKQDFDSQRAWLVFYLHTVIGYTLVNISTLLSIHKSTALRNKQLVQETIIEFLIDNLGSDFVNKTKRKIELKWITVNQLIELEDEEKDKKTKEKYRELRYEAENKRVCAREFQIIASLIRGYGYNV